MTIKDKQPQDRWYPSGELPVERGESKALYQARIQEAKEAHLKVSEDYADEII
jgi:hypothetical protein